MHAAPVFTGSANPMQDRKRDILRTAKASGLFALARKASARAVRILCYHGLWQGDQRFAGDSMFMAPATFRRRLEIMRASGYPVVRLDAAVAALRGDGRTLPANAVVITIDDGWASTYTDMLPALVAHRMPATLYCDTAQLLRGGSVPHVMARYLDKIAAAVPLSARPAGGDAALATAARAAATAVLRPIGERRAATADLARALGLDIAPLVAARTFDYMTPAELATAHHGGLDVQLHTHTHTLGDMRRENIEREISDNRDALAQVLNRRTESFEHFCYPSGVATEAAAQRLAALRLKSATTTAQGLAWPGSPMHLLPRLLDGENLSEIEFEAELSGFSDWLRAGKHATAHWRPHAHEQSPPLVRP